MTGANRCLDEAETGVFRRLTPVLASRCPPA
jgi:hypothetical protein